MNSLTLAGSRAVSLSVAGALLAAPSRADVLVVAAAGGGNFTELPAAIATALDGDILLQGVFLGAGGTVLGSVGSFALIDSTL